MPTRSPVVQGSHVYNSSQIVNASPLISIVGRNAATIGRCATPDRVDDSSHELD